MAKGRPSAYQPQYAEQATKLCELGATDVDLADFFGVTITTIKNWKSSYPDFLAALKLGKETVDNRVERSLYQRAMGYTFDAEKIQVLRDGTVVRVPHREHVPPDTVACIFWLKNRRKDQWRDVQSHEHGGVGDFDRMNDEELRDEISRRAQELGVSVPVRLTEH